LARQEIPGSPNRAEAEPESGSGKKKRLSYLEAREFATIEQRVEESDARLAAAHERVEDPSIASDAAALEHALAELEEAQQQSHALYARWAELSEKAG
jgi:ATP-binding cassette subfamily F protein uup